MTDTATKYAALHAGVRFLDANFGSADREEAHKTLGPEGGIILDGLVSQGWARYRPKHDDYALTEAGQRCDRATSAIEARV